MRVNTSLGRDRARRLRRDSTDAERILWRGLRDRRLCGLKFRRQHPIGRFVADFACPQARLVVELDGGQHARRTSGDIHRDRVLRGLGYRVLRFWNGDVLRDPSAVLKAIADAIGTPHLTPLPKGARREKLQADWPTRV
uniref:Endonuclease domain-containing protein n=1 Tax=candidate division WOR-3 bacterium TaxID=2052148 RepID=A0A7C4CB57_UNCW3